MSEPVAFCERNIKMWLGALVALALVVLGYATWLGWSTGQFNGFAAREQAPAAMPPQAAVMVPGQQAVVSSGREPIIAMPAPASSVAVGQPLAAQGVAMAAPLNAITRATPSGGIQFLGSAQPPSIQTSFNQAADVIRPTVVNVNAVRPGVAVQAEVNPNAFRFIDPFDGVPDKVIGQMAYDSVGSGVFVDPRGYLITNNHVVSGATSIVVTRFNEPQNYLTARLVATDTANDLALLQVMGDGPFPPASMADSSLVEVGDWVLAVGNPFGLEHTVTAGIVSARRGQLSIDGVVYNGIIQTDTPINRGSSGGPLVNLQGKMVGINTAIYAPTGVFNGTGFAVPSNRVSAFVARVLGGQAAAASATVPVAMPLAAAASTGVWLGVGVIEMTPDLARRLSFPYSGGVFVDSVILDSPADEAQVSRGDVILSLAGRTVGNADALDQVVASLAPGRPIEVTLWRGGKAETSQLTPKANRLLAR